jgi:carbon monoxide dehydrogenase subunit G
MDPNILAACIPGCQSLTDDGNNAYSMKLKVVLAALSGDFTGKVAIEDPQPPASYRLRLDGAGRIGFLRGHGDLRLSASDNGGTVVYYGGDVHAGGTLASVGQRLMDTTARMMIRRFFESVTTRLGPESTNGSNSSAPGEAG